MQGVGETKQKSPSKLSHYNVKSFRRPHLDYSDVLYDQQNNESLCQKIETAQYNPTPAITQSKVHLR